MGRKGNDVVVDNVVVVDDDDVVVDNVVVVDVGPKDNCMARNRKSRFDVMFNSQFQRLNSKRNWFLIQVYV